MITKKVAFFPAHPAQLWMMQPIAEAIASFADVRWVLRDKDCLLQLARRRQLSFTTISRSGTGLLSNAAEMARNTARCVQLTQREHIDLWFTKYGAANLAARITGRRSISFNDDDADVVPMVAWSSYPFADVVIVPTCTRMGRFEHKALRYRGTHELLYLHPRRFTPDPAIYGDLGIAPRTPYGIVRLVALQAHHDRGARGLTADLVGQIIKRITPAVKLFITSESALPPALEPYRCPLSAERIHHALAFAEFFIGDSQTMSLEAAQLGTPAFRFSSFVGRISVLEEMEALGLSFGFRPGSEAAMLQQLDRVLAMGQRRAEFQRRRERMLECRCDPLPLFVEAIRDLLQPDRCGASRSRLLQMRSGS